MNLPLPNSKKEEIVDSRMISDEIQGFIEDNK